MHGIELVFFSWLSRSRLTSLAVAVLTCFLLIGMVASTCGGIRDASRSTASSGGFSPMQAPGFRFTWSPRRLHLELFASVRFRLWLLPLPLLFFSSCACLVSSETAASRMLTVALAPDSERTFAFGRSFCSVSGSAPSSLVASWCSCLGACLPFVPCLFLWSHCHSRVNGRGAGEVLPIGLFPLSAFGQGRQSLAGPSVLRDDCLVPVQVSPLPLLRYPVSF